MLIRNLFFLTTSIMLGFLSQLFAQKQEIVWTPEPYEYLPGMSIKYIDYENGDDRNEGTKENPWQHHPWDANAKQKASSTSGVDTYVFKRGVIYRGSLNARESGTQDKPIKLTVDPSWGSGDAMFYGSESVPKNWKKLKNTEELPFPSASAEKIWYIDLRINYKPNLVWEVTTDGEINPVNVSRHPNWNESNPDDPRAEWWSFNDHKYSGDLELESTKGFSVGDKIWIAPGVKMRPLKQKSRNVPTLGNNEETSRGTIVGISGNVLKLELDGLVLPFLMGMNIANGKNTTKAVGDIANRKHRQVDLANLKGKPKDFFEDAFIWAEHNDYAGYGYPGTIKSYDPEEGSITFAKNYERFETKMRLPSWGCRYYFENKPQFLDIPGEFYYHPKSKRLYIRLMGDKDPNETQVEIARHQSLIEINDQSNIEVSGLTFRFENIISWLGKNQEAAAVKLRGNISGVKINNNQFEHLIKAVLYYPNKDFDVCDLIEISDNSIKHTEQNAIGISHGTGWVWGAADGPYNPQDEPFGRIIRAKILRNNIYDIGGRPASGDVTHAVLLKGGEIVEIAYNVVKNTTGGAIQSMNAGNVAEKHSVKKQLNTLCQRILIHHNKVENTLLMTHDWGAIGSWGVGPAYMYDNISGNPVGYRNFKYNSPYNLIRENEKWALYKAHTFGVAFYLDHAYKHYVFNNIGWGKNNNTNDQFFNAVGFYETRGVNHYLFQNTFYNFTVGTAKSYPNTANHKYIGNLFLNMYDTYFASTQNLKLVDFSTWAYANNVYQKGAKEFGIGPKKQYYTLSEWQGLLQDKESYQSTTGQVVDGELVMNVKEHDFRLSGHKSTVDKGVKMFVPWGLYNVVGEWHFYKDNTDPNRVLDESVRLDDEWKSGNSKELIPRCHLLGKNFEAGSYEDGLLEDWTEGALRFNGKDQFLTLEDKYIKSTIPGKNFQGKTTKGYPGHKRLMPDVDLDNFLIEVVFKTSNKHKGGVIVSKGNETGYELNINDNGQLALNIQASGQQFVITTNQLINDDKWHHVIAEVDRKKKSVILYVDSQLAEITTKGTFPWQKNLRNDSDFTVGRRSGSNEGYFMGSIDFLRISRGSFEDAYTNIDELYRWEFDGPFLKDFLGNAPKGNGRDVGAFEGF